MRRTSRSATALSASAVGALVLALGPLAGPAWATGSHSSGAHRTNVVTEDNDTNDGGTPNNVADDGDNRHPSGKDRSVEHGGSGNQGKATSDPDDDGHGPDRSNGGPDKPGGSGGVDKADQDANNGCGNDDDFEDDNEGWCGRKPHEEHAPAKTSPSKTSAAKTSPAKTSPATGTPVCVFHETGMTSGSGCAVPAHSTCVLVGTVRAAEVERKHFKTVVQLPAGASPEVVTKAAQVLATGATLPPMPTPDQLAAALTTAALTTAAPAGAEVLAAELEAPTMGGAGSTTTTAPASGSASLAAAAAVDDSAPSGSLPFTGGSLALAAIAGAFLIGGTFLVHAARSRRFD